MKNILQKNLTKKKYFKIFFHLNNYLGSLKELKSIYSHFYFKYYRLNTIILNVYLSYLSFNNFLYLFKSAILNKCKFFFISNNLKFSDFIFYYSKKINQYCFIGSWPSGLLTNLNIFFKDKFLIKNKKANLDNSFFLQSKKDFVKNIHFFFLFSSNNLFLDLKIVKECLKYNIPVIGFFDTSFNIEHSLYFLLTNTKNFLNIYFLFYLVIKTYILFKNKFYRKVLKNKFSYNKNFFYSFNFYKNQKKLLL